MPKTLKMFVLKQIIRHHSNNTPIKAIARHCGVSRNTVKHYLKLVEERKGLTVSYPCPQTHKPGT